MDKDTKMLNHIMHCGFKCIIGLILCECIYECVNIIDLDEWTRHDLLFSIVVTVYVHILYTFTSIFLGIKNIIIKEK